MRYVHPIPKVDNTLAQLTEATVIKIDTNSGFWQILLAKESRPLTTFITPYGRYFFNKLSFTIVISCTPKLFQLRMNRILEGLQGVVCQMDDVLVFSSNQTEHDQQLITILEQIKAAGVTLNRDKCKFSVHVVKFLNKLTHGPNYYWKAHPKQHGCPMERINTLKSYCGCYFEFCYYHFKISLLFLRGSAISCVYVFGTYYLSLLA